MEHLMITSSLYYARMKNVELPKVYQETRALREDKVKEQKELERIGEHNEGESESIRAEVISTDQNA